MSNEELCILAQQGNLETRNALILNNQNYIYKEVSMPLALLFILLFWMPLLLF